MRVITSLIWMTATLFSLLFADNGVQPDTSTQNDPSILMQTSTFTPSHPECNKAPRVAEILPVKPVAVPTPIEKPIEVATAAPAVALDSDHDGVIDPIDECPNTPRGYKVDKVGCPSSVTLHMNFKSGSSVLPKSSEKDIQILTEFMQDNPAATITIIGHTDSTGKAANNLVLSKARAEALSVRIIENGISDKRIISEGKGLSEPIASNKTKKGRAQNRRINIQIR